MSFLDKAKKAATDALEKHGDKVAPAIDKAAKAVDQRTGRKHSAQIDSASRKAKEAVERLDKNRGQGRGSEQPGQPGQPGHRTDPEAPR